MRSVTWRSTFRKHASGPCSTPWSVVVKYTAGRGRRHHTSDNNYHANGTESQTVVLYCSTAWSSQLVAANGDRNNARQPRRMFASARTEIFRTRSHARLYCDPGGAWEGSLCQQLFDVPW